MSASSRVKYEKILLMMHSRNTDEIGGNWDKEVKKTYRRLLWTPLVILATKGCLEKCSVRGRNDLKLTATVFHARIEWWERHNNGTK